MGALPIYQATFGTDMVGVMGNASHPLYFHFLEHLNDGEYSPSFMFSSLPSICNDGKHSLSFWLSPTCWGLGLAREAVARVVAHFTTTVGARPIWAGAAVWNEPSARLLLALGFFEDTLLEDGYSVDGQSFAVRQFWLAARAPL